ncbi:MAG: pentapeptide repeat-containing protein [bacterium]
MSIRIYFNQKSKFYQSNLANADLAEADLSGGTSEDASLINANLYRVQVQALVVKFMGQILPGHAFTQGISIAAKAWKRRTPYMSFS